MDAGAADVDDKEAGERAQQPTLESIAKGARRGLLLVAGAPKLGLTCVGPFLLAALAVEAATLPEVLQTSDPALLADHLAILFPTGEGSLQLGCALHCITWAHACVQIGRSRHIDHSGSCNAGQSRPMRLRRHRMPMTCIGRPWHVPSREDLRAKLGQHSSRQQQKHLLSS